MIINELNENILNTAHKRHVAFAVNTEGINDGGFSGYIASMYWPELANMGKSVLGTVYTKEYQNFVFHALVCHSLVNNWPSDTEKIIEKCFNAIPTDEPICSIAIGTGLIGFLTGSKWHKVKKGMEKSRKEIIVYKK